MIVSCHFKRMLFNNNKKTKNWRASVFYILPSYTQCIRARFQCVHKHESHKDMMRECAMTKMWVTSLILISEKCIGFLYDIYLHLAE